MPETPSAAYERGLDDGRIETTLQQHTAHLAEINGSQMRMANELGDLMAGQRRIESRMDSDAAITIALAKALEELNRARRWAFTRAVAIVGSLGVLVTIVVTIYANTRG